MRSISIQGAVMINKSELTRLLRDASDLEEGVMGFLTKYLEKYFDWTGFPEDKVAEAKNLIDRMRTDSEKHNRVVEELLAWISGRGEDEF
jgi:rubrerythrin